MSNHKRSADNDDPPTKKQTIAEQPLRQLLATNYPGVQPMLAYNKYMENRPATAPLFLRIAYQSVENYDKKIINPKVNQWTRKATSHDEKRLANGVTIGMHRGYNNRNLEETSVKTLNNPATFTLHDILTNICAQSATPPNFNQELGSSISPHIIVIGECSTNIEFTSSLASFYRRKDFNATDRATAQMSCFYQINLENDLKFSEITNEDRNAFLIEWKGWKICFVHIPNKIAEKDANCQSYLSALSKNGGYDLVVGDFNRTPSALPCNSYAPANGPNYFIDTKLTHVIGTNSNLNQSIDGIASPLNVINPSLNNESRCTDTVVYYKGLLTRVIPLSNGEGKVFSDHLGFIFDINAPLLNKSEH